MRTSSSNNKYPETSSRTSGANRFRIVNAFVSLLLCLTIAFGVLFTRSGAFYGQFDLSLGSVYSILLRYPLTFIATVILLCISRCPARQQVSHKHLGLFSLVSLLFGALYFNGAYVEMAGSVFCPNSIGKTLEAVFCILCCSALFLSILVLIDRYVDETKKRPIDEKSNPRRIAAHVVASINNVFIKRPFAAPSLLLIVLWLPGVVAYLPGLLMGDSPSQIYMWFGIENSKHEMIVGLTDSVTMTTHYPVPHTVLLGLFMQLGIDAFGNIDYGFLAYSLFQLSILIAAIGYSARLLIRIGTNGIAIFSLILFLGLVPWYVDYAMLITKDTLFSAGLLLMVVQLVSTLESGKHSGDIPRLVCSTLLVAFFRNGGIFFALAGLSACIIVNKLRNHSFNGFANRFLVRFGVILVALFFVFDAMVYPSFGISKGSTVEMMSVPFQQTASYVKNHGDDIDNDTQAAIDKVLVYEGLGARYDPYISDPVKDYAAKHRKNVSTDEYLTYFKAWVAMGLDDPLCYLNAYSNNYYGYFYTSNAIPSFYDYKGGQKMRKKISGWTDINLPLNKEGWVPSLTSFETVYSDFFLNNEFLSLTMNSSVYFWLLVAVTAIAHHRRKVSLVPALVICWAIVLVFLLGPCNGAFYNRYIFPLALCLPFLLFALANSHNEQSLDSTQRLQTNLSS